MLRALTGFDDAALADALDVGETHVGHGRAAVEPALGLHLQDDVFEHFFFVLIQGELFQDPLIALDELAGREAQGQAVGGRVVLDQVADRVQAAVDRAAVVVRAAEVLAQGPLLVFGHMDRVLDQLVDALILRRGDRHDRDAQHGLHRVDVHAAAVACHLIHHVEGDDHRHVHFQKLHRQVEVALDVRGVHDIDDAPGLGFQDEVPGNQLLAGIGRHRIDAGKICDPGVGIAADRAVLPVHGDAWEVADVLVCSGELVEQRGLAAVLVADQGEGQLRALRKGVAAAPGMELALLAEAGVSGPALA